MADPITVSNVRSSDNTITGESHTIGEDTSNLVFLNEVPKEVDGVTIAGFTEITSGSPSAGEFLVTYTGDLASKVEFHSSDDSTAITVDYTGLGSNNLAHFINRIVNRADLADANIAAGAEIAVSKLADGTARQLLQTDAAGTGVEWASNIDIPGTLDVTGAAVFDSTLSVGGTITSGTTSTTTPVLTLTDSGVASYDWTFPDSSTVQFDPGTGSDKTFKVVNSGAGSFNLEVDGTLDVTGVLTADSSVFINETSNANMTTGLTINQGAADDEILAFKSSDVAHGVTAFSETDTFAWAQKYDGPSGGLSLRAVRGGASPTGMELYAIAGGDDTAKTTAALGYFRLRAGKISSSSVQTPGADANLLVIQDRTVTRFIFDTEGSAHADVEFTTFDQHNDLQLIEDIETLAAPGQVERRFGEVVRYDRDFLEGEGLFHDIRDVGDGRTRGMMNMTKMLMLHSGAIRQVGGMVLDVASREQRLESALRELIDSNDTLRGRKSALALLEEAA